MEYFQRAFEIRSAIAVNFSRLKFNFGRLKSMSYIDINGIR